MKTRIEPLETRIAPALIVALTQTNSLLTFDSDTPNDVDGPIPVTGLGANEALVGIDFRPSTGDLIGSTVTNGSVVNSVITTYVIDPSTGAATLIGNTVLPLAGAGEVPTGFDFNPLADRIRYVNTNDENSRLNPNNGSLAGNDTDLTPAATTEIIGSAYSYGTGPVTTLYCIDRDANTLSIQGGINGSPSPNGGVVTDLASLGFTLSATADGGFDIGLDNAAFAGLTDNADNLTRLYAIDLDGASNVATVVGLIGNGTTRIRSLAIEIPGAIQFPSAKTAKYTDEDGDKVTVTVSKGELGIADLDVSVFAGGRALLRNVNFFDDGTEFDGANLTITAAKGVNGDGLVNVGRVLADGIDLANVVIKGDLGVIDVGDGDTTDVSLAKLSTRSIGRYAGATQGGSPDLESDINGPIGTLAVTGDIINAKIIITVGGIQNLTIGGSLIGGTSDSSGLINGSTFGAIKIGRDLVGGDGLKSGQILAVGTVKSVTIGGFVLGGTGEQSGSFIAVGSVGAVKVGRDVRGGTAVNSGNIFSSTSIGSVTIGGSVIGGSASGAGWIFSPGQTGAVKIGRDLIGGSAFGTGRLSLLGKTLSVTIGGSIIGGQGSDCAELITGESGPIKIGGSLIGGSVAGASTIARSGYIEGNRLTSVTIRGSIISGIDDSTGDLLGSASIRATNDIGSLIVGGSIVGNAATGQVSPVSISARGQFTPGASSDVAIGRITVGGRVERAEILAGYSTGLTAINGDASIGSVTVKGDWIASDLVAGVQDDGTIVLDDGFGDADDILAGVGTALIARIAKIAIKGVVLGTGATTGDHFGFVSEQIGAFNAQGYKAPLTTGVDVIQISLLTGDFTIREV